MRFAFLLFIFLLIYVAGCCAVPRTEVIATGECTEEGKATVQVTAKVLIVE